MLPSRRQIWMERLARYRASALTVKAFCKAENISVPSFYQWKKALSEVEVMISPTFVPIDLARPLGDDFDLVLPGGAIVKLSSQLDDAALRKVISAVVAATAQADAS